jgi:hypothetical protein
MTVIKIDTTARPASERIDVFEIDGETYSMPAEVNGGFALEAMEVIGTRGEVAAMPWLLEKALGRKGYTALRNCPTLTAADLKAVTRIVQDHVMGQLEELGKD